MKQGTKTKGKQTKTSKKNNLYVLEEYLHDVVNQRLISLTGLVDELEPDEHSYLYQTQVKIHEALYWYNLYLEETGASNE
jgi:hypothetical protein